MAVSAALLAAACGGSSAPGGVTGSGSGDGGAGSGSGSGTETGSGSGTETGAGGEAVIDLGDDEIVLTAALSAFDECGSLLDHLRSEYAERVGPWGFEGEGWYGPGIPELAMEADMEDQAMTESTAGADGPDSGSAEAAAAGLVEGVDYSGTNVQEAGVDEADLVKTDGRRIFAVSNGLLLLVDAASRQIEWSVRLASEHATELLLDGDDLLVILNDYSPPVRLALEPEGSAADQPVGYDQPATVVQRVRADGNILRIIETLRIDGAYVSARSVGGVARVVTRHDPSWSFPFVYPQGGSGSEEVAEEANRAAVLASTLEDWLPSYTVTAGANPPSGGGLLPSCENVYVPSEFAGFGVTTVLSLPVGGRLAGEGAVSVMAPGDTVYATPRSLYVATSAWIAPELLEDETARQRAAADWRAAIHRFDLTDPDRAAYAASGLVPGRIHNQFSLSEHDEHLRVVTTTGDLWWGQDGTEPSSQVRVLRQTGDRLVEVGSVGDIGRGEQVQSVRFTGDIGYVVTFRQVDPFYTLDLSDPENPAVVGELKIPGFSSYLHPIGDDLVLGVGFDADETTGATTGSKVSLFDVSDLANPLELDVWIAPDAYNDAGWDHRAFLWWEPARMAVFGISSWTDQTAEAVALRVEGGSLAEIGRIDHIDPSVDIGSTDCRRLDPSPPAEVETESELWYTLTYSDNIACEPGESPAMVGFDCWPVDWVQEEARASGVIADGETMFSCQFGSLDVIVRSMVIGDELWTLSYQDGNTWQSRTGKLAASDLATLQRVALINLF